MSEGAPQDGRTGYCTLRPPHGCMVSDPASQSSYDVILGTASVEFDSGEVYVALLMYTSTVGDLANWVAERSSWPPHAFQLYYYDRTGTRIYCSDLSAKIFQLSMPPGILRRFRAAAISSGIFFS